MADPRCYGFEGAWGLGEDDPTPPAGCGLSMRYCPHFSNTVRMCSSGFNWSIMVFRSPGKTVLGMLALGCWS